MQIVDICHQCFLPDGVHRRCHTCALRLEQMLTRGGRHTIRIQISTLETLWDGIVVDAATLPGALMGSNGIGADDLQY